MFQQRFFEENPVRRPRFTIRLVAVLTGALAAPAAAQDSIPLMVGTLAPDFELPGATREGLAGRIRLSDFRDQTVVIAFFYRARSRG